MCVRTYNFFSMNELARPVMGAIFVVIECMNVTVGEHTYETLSIHVYPYLCQKHVRPDADMIMICTGKLRFRQWINTRIELKYKMKRKVNIDFNVKLLLGLYFKCQTNTIVVTFNTLSAEVGFQILFRESLAHY